jgi:phosphatidylglycerol:prolipoprotein diacylglycerol transferase
MWVHDLKPVALSLGPVSIHWYGLMYLVAFGLFLWLMRRQIAKPWHVAQGWSAKDVDDLLFFGVLGVIAALAWFARARGRSFWDVTDIVAPCVPTGLAAGRVGNFINGELWGRAASPELPWAMAFPASGDLLPRHPSQLYQAAAEGLLLFALLWWVAAKPRQQGAISGLFLIGYGALRFVMEFFREPDHFDFGLKALPLSQGQTLCVAMIVAGLAILAWSRRKSP